MCAFVECTYSSFENAIMQPKFKTAILHTITNKDLCTKNTHTVYSMPTYSLYIKCSPLYYCPNIHITNDDKSQSSEILKLKQSCTTKKFSKLIYDLVSTKFNSRQCMKLTVQTANFVNSSSKFCRSSAVLLPVGVDR